MGTEFKGTPGPWLYRAKSDDVYTAPPEGSAYNYGDFIFGFNDSFPPSDADLALILAAPDMYEVLVRYLPIIEGLEGQPDLWSELASANGIATANSYRHALAKATGEAP